MKSNYGYSTIFAIFVPLIHQSMSQEPLDAKNT